MQELTSHKTNELNEAITIAALEDGQCNYYRMGLQSTCQNDDASVPMVCNIFFQNGPPSQNGFNGFTNEALMAILEHRFESMQKGPFACRENALALTHLQESMHWLEHRTNRRKREGKEGTHQV